jgi:hypothetical protein
VRLRHLAAFATALLVAACGDPGSSDGLGPSDEPNDTVAQAMPLAVAAPTGGTLGTETDVDYYEFTVPAGGAFVQVQTFDADGVGCDALDTYLALVRDDSTPLGAVLAADDDSGSYFCSNLVRWLEAGTYYVAVSFGTVAAPGLEYTVLVTLTLPDAGDHAEAEPNDTAATANGTFTADALVAGTLTPGTDADYYRFTNNTGYTRSVYLETFEHAVGYCPYADTTISVYQADGTTWFGENLDSGVNYCSRLGVTVPAGVTVFVKVEGTGGTFSYLLEIDFI